MLLLHLLPGLNEQEIALVLVLFCFVLFLMCSVIESATSVLCFAIMQAVRVT